MSLQRGLLLCVAVVFCAGLQVSEQTEGEALPPRTGHFQISSDVLDTAKIEKLRQRHQPAGSRRRRKSNKGKQVRQESPVTWEVYVPPQFRPESPPGVFVYISPTPHGRIMTDYQPVMDRHNLIWIGANDSGNAQSLDRRMHLALAALAQIERRYPVDENRRYVGGLSGGGRTSSILSMSMPEEFSGGYFICGCNFYRHVHVGGHNYRRGFWPQVSFPVLQRARRGRYVFCTGAQDGNNAETHRVYEAYKAEGFKHLLLQDIPDMGHTLPPPAWLEEGIVFLDAPLNKPATP